MKQRNVHSFIYIIYCYIFSVLIKIYEITLYFYLIYNLRIAIPSPGIFSVGALEIDPCAYFLKAVWIGLGKIYGSREAAFLHYSPP